MNELGLKLLKSFESCRLEAYFDSAGVLTIGWGDTWHVYHETDSCTQEQADLWLSECLGDLESHLNDLVKIELNSDQKSALLDFMYNEGYGNLRGSTLLYKINRGDLNVGEEFEKWDKAGGQVLGGLLARRKAEWALFSGKEQEVVAILKSRGSV